MNGVCPSFIFRLFVNLIFSFLVFDSHRAGLQLFNIVKRANNRGEDFSGLERRRCCLYSSKCGCQLYTNGCPPPGIRICHGSHYFKVDYDQQLNWLNRSGSVPFEVVSGEL